MHQTLNWLRAFVPQRNTVPRHERMRAVAGALVGLLLTAGLSMHLVGTATLPLALVAPMGASAVLLFCVPASPLAQPWSVIGGNTISALVGIACAKAIGNPLLAGPLAGALAILVMFLLRCLHPPSGAVALTTVLGGPAVHAAGFGFAFVPVGLNSALIVLVALVFNNLTGRRYPHAQQSMLKNVHATRDPVPTARIGFTREDLDAALARYGQVLDISRDDLEEILLETEAQAYGRRFGVITCGAIMSKDAVTVRPGMPLGEAWRLLRQHGLHALPVLDKAGRVVGVVGQNDFLHHLGLDDYQTLSERLRGLAGHLFGLRGERPAKVVDIMQRHVQTVGATDPIAELVPLMSNRGLHHIPVVDAGGIFAGVVSHSDLLAALFEGRLTEPA
ncbi:HPP family protein [Massilia norwichensis]|uniref:HPP family protein n=1 Tax=Massilia norwichensis TaxID=1442366 RepID=A0ABT2ABG3_9BURK|nr:HPP family protein [Massilia norwichensis]MCS0591549.1 HPP family protein [Massilia norwichensis]